MSYQYSKAATSASQEKSNSTPQLPSYAPLPHQAIGKPSSKKRFHKADLLAAGVTLLCLTLGIASVADETLSWQLGQGTHQLIALGFLLSIMSLCLTSVTPTLFLILETRFGTSTLQNYEGILRNDCTSSRMGLTWRLVHAFMTALPIGLSVAYKSFAGGHSVRSVDASHYVHEEPTFGPCGPPGVLPIGFGIGVTLFFNVTLPFAISTSNWLLGNTEPALPTAPQAYGFNLLLVDKGASAVLDVPNPHFVQDIQFMLAEGESWNLTAPVIGTVATVNHSKEENPEQWEKDFFKACNNSRHSSGSFTHQSLLNGWAIDLIDDPSPGNQSWQYISISPDPGIDNLPECDSNLSAHAHRFDITRQRCYGTWSISRGNVLLVDGNCTGEVLPPAKQLPLTDNDMFLGLWYMPALVEFLGPFSDSRNQSDWMIPSFATVTAAMLWSRITAMNSPYRLHANGFVRDWRDPNERVISSKDVGLLYEPDMKIIYSRPTLRKSAILYFVITIQPLLTILALCATWCLYSTPLGRGFGLVSILSGINRDSLDSLHGASLSGELWEKANLAIEAVQDGHKHHLAYHIHPRTAPAHHGRVERKAVYH
ncbi:hypothetical protein NM208_g8342 [Fusarium decemcellulare]|uniref:Uncharacterized protein n=1 Tax=Fusarium decemcellulare TaxID=57161 RepID=A0ACC1S5T9_9HYPO|nr:hypothetical protein NM208_g8342 [Fusarium decemcellulare]